MNIHDLALMRQRSRKVSKEEIEAIQQDLKMDEEIADSIARLCAVERFYECIFGPFVRRIRVDDPEQLSTMSVKLNRYRDGFDLSWNPQFWRSLNPMERLDLLRHEAGHIMNDHLQLAAEIRGLQLKTNQIKMLNAAYDLAINDPTYMHHLPNGGYVAGKPVLRAEVGPNGFVYDEKGKPILREVDASYSSFIRGMKPGLTSNEYYDLLVTHMMQGGEGDGANYIGAHPWMEGNGEAGSPYLDPNERIAIRNLSDAVRAAMAAKKSELDNCGGWGSMSLSMIEHIRKITAPRVDWRAYLKRVVASSIRSGKESSWRHVSRRTPWAAPGSKHTYLPKVHAYIDVSGSHMNDAVGMSFDVLGQISALNEVMVYQFDTHLSDPSKWRRGRALPAIRLGCGGTDFRVPRQHSDDTKDLRLSVILTDGECMDPGPPKGGYKIIWLITPGGTTQEWMTKYGSACIKMEHDSVTTIKDLSASAAGRV